MHPGPVNRGVELVRRGDRLAAGGDRPAGRGRRRRPHGGALRAAGGPRRARTARPRRPRSSRDGALESNGGPTHSPLVVRDSAPADLLIRGAHVLDPRAGHRRAARRARPRRRDRRDRRARHARGARTAPRSLDGEGRHLFPGFVDPHVHLRTPGPGAQGGPRDRHPRGRGRRLRRGHRDAEHRPGRRLRAGPALAARGGAARGARAGRLPRLGHARPGRRGADRDGRAARRRRARLHRRRQARRTAPAILRTALQYQRLCGGMLALHEEDPSLSRRAASCTRARCRARLGLAGIPTISRVDDDRPRRRDRRLRGRPHPHPAPERARVGRGGRRGQGARRADHLRGVARTTSR